MPQAVLVAAIPAVAAIGSAVVSSKAQSSSTTRSLAAQRAAATRAEAFEREQDALNRAERDREAAEQKRQFEITQANLARQQAQEDAITRDNLERAAYEDAIRYGKAVNLARLTGNPVPQAPPPRTAASLLNPQSQASSNSPVGGLMLARPSSANAMVDRAPVRVSPLARPMGSEMGMPSEMPRTLGELARRRRMPPIGV